MLAHLHVLFAGTTLNWVRRLGGPGLVLLGFADNSVVPLPGSMDVLTIWLAARHRDLWPYYAFMATAGAVLGGYVTYSLGRKGGKQAIERKLHKDRAQRLFSRFSHWDSGRSSSAQCCRPRFPWCRSCWPQAHFNIRARSL